MSRRERSHLPARESNEGLEPQNPHPLAATNDISHHDEEE